MIDEGRVVLPGDKVAVTEELKAGDGTYEINGEIFSSIVGIFRIDRKKMRALVEPITSIPLVIKEGDIVICEVKQIGDAMMICRILHIANKKRQIAGEKDVAIHISNISEEYVENIGEKFRIGDIMRAKIIKAEPVLQATVKESQFGVIKAYCTNCRNPLIRKNNLLECKICGSVEERKIADDYGEGNIDRGG